MVALAKVRGITTMLENSANCVAVNALLVSRARKAVSEASSSAMPAAFV